MYTTSTATATRSFKSTLKPRWYCTSIKYPSHTRTLLIRDVCKTTSALRPHSARSPDQLKPLADAARSSFRPCCLSWVPSFPSSSAGPAVRSNQSVYALTGAPPCAAAAAARRALALPRPATSLPRPGPAPPPTAIPRCPPCQQRPAPPGCRRTGWHSAPAPSWSMCGAT